MQAVDSENKKNLRNDFWRLYQLEKSLSDPNHPYSKFGTGNLVTLGEEPRAQGLDIRQTLIEFYERHYSANLMRLVVYGAEPLDKLQGWVETLFSGVPNRGHAVTRWDPKPWAPNNTRQLIIAKSIKNLRSLYLCWQVPDQRTHFLTKPASYYSHLLGHEGAGSLLSLLKARGWATRLSVGLDDEASGFAFFQLIIEMSAEGLAHYPAIVELVFAYLRLLEETGPQPAIYAECHELEQLAFRFRDKSPPARLAHHLARNMQIYPPAYIIAGPHAMQAYDEGLLRGFLAELRDLNNFRMLLACADVELEPGTDWLREQWYGTEYLTKPLEPAFLLRLQEVQPPAGNLLHLPDPNPFIPADVAVKLADSRANPLRSPRLVLDQPAMRVWHKLDDTFETPKANVYAFLRSPIVSNSPLNFIKSYLVVECWRDALNEAAYPAELAGLRYDLVLNSDGIDIRISGFHDKIPVLVEQLFDRLANFTIEPHRFDLVKDQVRLPCLLKVASICGG